MLSLKRIPRYEPRPPRMVAKVPASMLCQDGNELPVWLSNISEGGCAVEVPAGHRLQPGEWAGIELPGYAIIRCQVRWQDEDVLGLRFERAIPLDWVD